MDFGGRNYDASLGRWMNIDPLAEDYHRWSPYNFVYNNPLKFTDPTGKGPEWVKNGDGTYTAEAGDSASSLHTQHLAEKGFTFEQVNAIVQQQHGENRIEDGIEKSNIDPGQGVEVAQEVDAFQAEFEANTEKVAEINKSLTENGEKREVLQSQMDSIDNVIEKDLKQIESDNIPKIGEAVSSPSKVGSLFTVIKNLINLSQMSNSEKAKEQKQQEINQLNTQDSISNDLLEKITFPE